MLRVFSSLVFMFIVNFNKCQSYGLGGTRESGVYMERMNVCSESRWLEAEDRDTAAAGSRGPICSAVKQQQMNYWATSESPGDGCSSKSQITASKR